MEMLLTCYLYLQSQSEELKEFLLIHLRNSTPMILHCHTEQRILYVPPVLKSREIDIRSFPVNMKKGVRSYKTFEEGEDAEIYVLKYLNRTTFSMTVFIVCCILSAGVFYVMSRWFLSLQLLKYSESNSHNASHVLVSSILGDKTILRLRRVHVPESALGHQNSSQIIQLIVYPI